VTDTFAAVVSHYALQWENLLSWDPY